VIVLSHFEHVRSVRPSFLLNVYLFFSLILDLGQARTLYLLEDDTPKASVFSATMGIKLALLFLEAQEKASYLRKPYSTLPPESTSGIWSQSTFWWLNSLIYQGFQKLLSMKELYDLDIDLASEKLKEDMQKAWDTRCMLVYAYAYIFYLYKAKILTSKARAPRYIDNHNF
jgi:ATP-binding cassette, subfamily C (CFTR/MRP), member 1